MSSSDPHVAAALSALGRTLREQDDGEISDAESAASFKAALSSSKVARSQHRTVLLLAACFVTVTALAVWALRPAAPLTVETANARVSPSGYLQPVSHEDMRISFSDGSRVFLASTSRGRVGQLTPNGARVTLDTGRMSCDFRHRAGAEWQIEAGPYQVTVIGTRFDLDWDHALEHLLLDLHQGAVRVVGPAAPEGVLVSAGQRLEVSSVGGRPVLSLTPSGSSYPSQPQLPEPPAPAVTAPSSAEPSSPVSSSEPAAALASPKPTTSSSTAAWAEWAREGQFARIIEQAKGMGVERAVTTLAGRELAALADAARYRSETDIAERALLAQRRRFAGSVEGRAAAFFLGRLEEEQRRRPAEALRWYERYLAEAPKGALAAEALGRKMMLLAASGAKEQSKQLAQQYLLAHPSGAYAARAKKLLQVP